MADQFTSVGFDQENPSSPHTPSTEIPINDPLQQSTGSTDEDTGSGLITTEMLSEAAVNSPEPAAADIEPSEQDVPDPHDTIVLDSKSDKQAPPVQDYTIETKVTDPVMEKEGQNTYIDYQVDVTTDDPKLKKPQYSIRHRYSDFYFLYECLMNDYPTLLIPPLPNKQRLEYIKGGRFSDEFTAKRAVSLSTFLRRVCHHPTLKRSQVLHIFLDESDYWNTYKQNLKVPSVGSLDSANSATQNLETMTEFIMNSFKKPSVESKNKHEFEEIQTRTTKLHDNLNRIDHIYNRVLHKQQNIANGLDKFGQEFGQLTLLLGNDFEGKHQEPEDLDEGTRQMLKKFDQFAANLKESSASINTLDHDIEYNYLTSLKDLEHYIMQLRNLLKLKDDKALDYEMLSNYLDKSKEERSNLMNGGSITSTTEGTISFLTKKFESFTGLGPRDTSNLTNERIHKLEARIEMLEKEKAQAKKIYDQYDRDIVTEFEHFNQVKNDEIGGSLSDLCGYYLQFHKRLDSEMKPVDLPATGDMGFTNKLSKDGKLFSNNQVQKNDEAIKTSVERIQERDGPF